MKKNNVLLNIQDLCKFFGLSEPTIRRRIREAKQGIGSFPAPIFGYGKKVLWYREDIINYRETERANPDQ